MDDKGKVAVPTYDEWNSALIDYLTRGAPRGVGIFLDVNDDILEDIGEHSFTTSSAGATRWTDDFKRAVRAQCVARSEVKLQSLFGHTPEALPRGVAFLGAMVLAAYYMGEDDAVTSINYFKRLREVLGLAYGEGRPNGMEQGSEALLWSVWGLWLQRQGFLPTAQAGKGAKIYINYPISQSLLRRTDKDRLFKLFEEKKWPPHLDQNIVTARIRHEILQLSKHVQTLLQEGNISRYQAVSEAAFEVYEEWVALGRKATVNRGASRHLLHRNLFAELYRITELGDAIYYLYPRQPRRFHSTRLQVSRNGVIEELVEDRQGWYEPLWKEPISGNEIDKGARYELVGHSNFQYLVLPTRDFWILTREPDNPDSGVYISGSTPELGIPFILICKRDLQSQIAHLRNERLINWHGDPHPLSINSEWVEYRGMMVLSEAWSGVFIKNRDLYESLRPFSSINISFEGGLRVPSFSAWLVDYGPKITIVTFYEKARVGVKEAGSERVLLNQEVSRDEPIQIQWSEPGDYIVEAWAGAQSTERLVKILSWDLLPQAEVEPIESLRIGSWHIYGPLVESREEKM